MLTRKQKEKIIAEVSEELKRALGVIFVDFTGLRVSEIQELKRKLKGVDAKLSVVKKTLTRIALRSVGLEVDIDRFPGPLALITTKDSDISLLAKEVYNFSRVHQNLKILGGLSGAQFIEPKEVVAIARLPSREALLGQVISGLASPLSNFVSTLQGNIRGLLIVLGRIK